MQPSCKAVWNNGPAMFTAEQRDRVRSDLLELAARDPRISGAAITGSGPTGEEDQWSDIDLAFGVGETHELSDVLADWTAHTYDRHFALHHLDLRVGTWLYRVFVLPSTLQIDLAFAPAMEFRPLASTFRLVFGTANEPRRFPAPELDGQIMGYRLAKIESSRWRREMVASDRCAWRRTSKLME